MTKVHGLQLGGGHRMHVEEHGNPRGRPLLLLHGGPGSGCSPALRSGIDPERFRIICPDQRGAGRSTPAGAITSNTLADLLADLRLLRAHLGIAQWLVAGGSWGATLALAHAVDQPQAVSGLVLRNPFLARDCDIREFFDGAAHQGGPGWHALWEQARQRHCPMPLLLAEIFAGGTPQQQCETAKYWFAWEQSLAGSNAPAPEDDADWLRGLVSRYRVMSHYLRHGCWLDDPTLLQRCAAAPAAVPVHIVQGAQDALCPPDGAQALAQALGDRATLELVPGAGHDPAHPALAAAWQRALDACAGFSAGVP